MKKLFLSIIALATSTVGYAQLSDGVSATLQAGETTTMFYGYDAFKDAIAAAPLRMPSAPLPCLRVPLITLAISPRA